MPSAAGWHGCLALDTVWVVWRRCADVGRVCVCVGRRWHHSNEDGFIFQTLLPTKTVLSPTCTSLSLPDCVRFCEFDVRPPIPCTYICTTLSCALAVKTTGRARGQPPHLHSCVLNKMAHLYLWAHFMKLPHRWQFPAQRRSLLESNLMKLVRISFHLINTPVITWCVWERVIDS